MYRIKTFHIKAGTWESARVEFPQHTHAFGVGFVVFSVFKHTTFEKKSVSSYCHANNGHCPAVCFQSEALNPLSKLCCFVISIAVPVLEETLPEGLPIG